MFKRRLEKPDGRELFLYGRAPIPADLPAPVPPGGRAAPPSSHLRWHPLRGEWVIYASHRQNRTFLPPPEYSPLAITTDAAAPTELPAGAWDVAVFENLFPALSSHAQDAPPASVATAPGQGRCEVVVYTQDPRGSLGALPPWHVELVLEVWADRTAALGARDDVAYVFPFENRGVEVGVTIHHPHGQIYAYPFVPPIIARELEQQRAYLAREGRGLLADMIRDELADRRRLVWASEAALAWVPVCARWAYEVWVAPRRPAATLADLDAGERRELARGLRTTLRRLDGLWGRPMPYVMAVHQGPSDGAPHPEAHVHVEIYPALRMKDRLKYLAGSEIGAGVFTSDTLPEDKAAELRAVVDAEEPGAGEAAP